MSLQQAMQNWHDATMPDETPAQVLLHLAKEVAELQAAPDDPEEAADVLLCLIAFVYRQGGTWGELEAAAWAKLATNRTRQWQRTPEGDYRHTA